MPVIYGSQIKKVAEMLKEAPVIKPPLNFYNYYVDGKEVVESDAYPALHDEHAVDFFFFTVLHQHGFWYDDGLGYACPITGTLDGKEYKGSDLLFRMAMRTYKKDPLLLTPKYLADISSEEMLQRFFTDDVGVLPFPDLQERLNLTRAYGQWFLGEGTTPEGILSLAHLGENALKGFLETMRTISGYNADPLEKKNNLLAMILSNRPEEFLARDANDEWSPIVDYHLMRVSLRLGLVRLTEEERRINESRQFVDPEMEHVIRKSIHTAITILIQRSGHSMFAIDELMWNARQYCPEMSEPECSQCVFKSVCRKDTKLFQPVLRTMAY